MSYTYRGTKPDRVYKCQDFYDKGIILSQYLRVPNRTRGQDQWARFVFRSNGLMGIIRYSCYCDTWCVDVQDSWHYGHYCLTTECRTISEAKSILYIWFKEHGFKKKVINDWKDKSALGYMGHQLSLSNMVFR